MKMNDDKYRIVVVQSAHNWYILLFSSLSSFPSLSSRLLRQGSPRLLLDWLRRRPVQRGQRR